MGVARHLEMASAGPGGSLKVASIELDWVFDQGQGGGNCWLLWPHSIETRAGLGPVRGGRGSLAGMQEGKSGAGAGREGKEAEDIGGLDSALYARARAAEASRQQEDSLKARYSSLCRRAEGDGWRGRVLVADADMALVLQVTDALVAEGYRVMACASGPKALELTRHQPFDALLLSTEVEGLSGVDVTRVLREREQGMQGAGQDGLPVLRLPVLAFTAATAPEDLRSYMECGMDGCVVKPLEMDTLLSTIAAAVPPPEGGPPPAARDARARGRDAERRAAAS